MAYIELSIAGLSLSGFLTCDAPRRIPFGGAHDNMAPG